MPRWFDLEPRLAEWMKRFARPGLKFTNGYQAIPGFPSDGFRADSLLTDGRVMIALEVEAAQSHPDTNVGKYWLLAEQHPYERIILFHVFTPAFRYYGWRMRLGEFYARRMEAELPFEYHLIDLRALADIDEAYARVTAEVGARIGAEFG